MEMWVSEGDYVKGKTDDGSMLLSDRETMEKGSETIAIGRENIVQWW